MAQLGTMSWLALLAVIALAGVVMWMGRALAEIRGYRRDWQDLANTQEKHETDIRWCIQLINPMARRGHAPMPRHLQEKRR